LGNGAIAPVQHRHEDVHGKVEQGGKDATGQQNPAGSPFTLFAFRLYYVLFHNISFMMAASSGSEFEQAVMTVSLDSVSHHALLI
jgi:hypothetical protein